jgi:hypothetical protein
MHPSIRSTSRFILIKKSVLLLERCEEARRTTTSDSYRQGDPSVNAILLLDTDTLPGDIRKGKLRVKRAEGRRKLSGRVIATGLLGTGTGREHELGLDGEDLFLEVERKEGITVVEPVRLICSVTTFPPEHLRKVSASRRTHCHSMGPELPVLNIPRTFGLFETSFTIGGMRIC